MKIVQLAAPTPAGGLERVVESLSIGLHQRGHDVTVAALLLDAQPRHPFVESLRTAGVPVRALRLPPRAYLTERREVRRLLRSLGPDIVHTHGYRIDLLERPVAAKLMIATVTTVHGFNRTGGLKGDFFEWLQRRNFRKFDAVVAVSAQLHKSMLAAGVPSDRMHHVPNAWSGTREALSRDAARHALKLELDATVVGWVGRFVPVKGADVFLEALSRVPAGGATGVLIGYGQDEIRLRNLAERLGLSGSVRFHTDIPDASRYFAAFDTYVLSSRSEGLPISLLEGMAARTPIVATRVGGVPDALREGEAWLIPPEDPDRLAEAIAESLRDRREAATRARRAAERLEADYSLAPFLDGYEQVYREALALKELNSVSHARAPRSA